MSGGGQISFKSSKTLVNAWRLTLLLLTPVLLGVFGALLDRADVQNLDLLLPSNVCDTAGEK